MSPSHCSLRDGAYAAPSFGSSPHLPGHRLTKIIEGSDGSVFVPANGHHGWHGHSTAAAATSAAASSAPAQDSVAASPKSYGATPGSSARQTPSVQKSYSPPSASSNAAASSSRQVTASSGASATTLHTATHKSEKGTKTATGAEQTGGEFTLKIKNQFGTPLSMAYGNNAGGPCAKGNPKDGMLSTSTQVVYPTGWAGRITFGQDGNGAGSKVEGSFTGLPDIDVSYVDGYSVPIVCSCGNDPTPITGCNLDLFSMGSCNVKGQNTMSGKTCINEVSPKNADGPTPPFFKPCEGAAYTYPTDDEANMGCQSTLMECCIGKSCPAVPRQPGKNGSGSGNATSY